MPHCFAHHQQLALPRQRQAQPSASREHCISLLQKPAPRCLCDSHPVAQLRNDRFINFAATPFLPHNLTTSAFAPVAALLFTLPSRCLNSK